MKLILAVFLVKMPKRMELGQDQRNGGQYRQPLALTFDLEFLLGTRRSTSLKSIGTNRAAGLIGGNKERSGIFTLKRAAAGFVENQRAVHPSAIHGVRQTYRAAAPPALGQELPFPNSGERFLFPQL
jgi:hypothetical protein